MPLLEREAPLASLTDHWAEARQGHGLFVCVAGEAGAQFTPRLLDTRSGENRIADYLAVNPMGKIPALADGSFRLWESNGINWYVAEKHPAAGLLPRPSRGARRCSAGSSSRPPM
jgi:glutathione S-transferase